MSDRPSPSPPSTGARSAFDPLLLLVLVPWAALVRWFWFVSDDAYISFRYSRNWGTGLGLVYNPGESPPTEGFSNFSMVALGAAVEALGLDIAFWLPLACAVAGLFLIVAVWRALRGPLGLGRMESFGATALLAWSAPFAVWSTSGLEAMPYALFFFLAFDRLVLLDAISLLADDDVVDRLTLDVVMRVFTRADAASASALDAEFDEFDESIADDGPFDGTETEDSP